MSKKKKKGIPFDEYYSNDPFELGRIGNIIATKNHLTDDDVKIWNKELANQYDEKKAEIDGLIDEIKSDIQKCNPLSLLLAATDRVMMNMMNTFSEIQIGGIHNFELRSIEYIQSLLVCQKTVEPRATEQEELIEKVINEIVTLYERIIQFYIFWGAKMITEDNTLTDEDIQYIIEAQLMGNVRGNRYQFQQLINIEKLLLPHSEKLQELYGVSGNELITGLRELEHTLSSGKLDSMKNIFNEYLQFQKDVQGKSPEEYGLLIDKIKNSKQNIDNCAKAFGTDLYNVKKVTGWSDELIDSLSWQIGECQDFFSDKEFSGWPIIDLPVQKRPFIKIEGISYCFDYYNLFDNIYRIIQKDIKRHDNGYTNIWSDIQQIASENLVAEQFKMLLPGCQCYIGNYYPKGKSLKQMDENDVMILYDDTLIIAEVKAGSFTFTPAITDYLAHKKSFEALIGKADYQCERTLTYIKNNQEIVFYENEKDRKQKFVINKEDYKNIYTLCVTVDNFNSFEAKIEKNNFFDVSSGTIAISIDELEVYREYFDSPLYFLHFLRHRKAATRVKSLMLSDELDHLGMYIVHNAYDTYANEFSDCDSLYANGYREELDFYFATLHCKELGYKKPIQDIPAVITEIIDFVDSKQLKDRVSFSSFLLDLHPDTRVELVNSIDKLYQRQAVTKRMFPVFCNGDIMYGCFVVQDGIELISEEFRLKYMYANMLQVNKEQSWYFALTYNQKQELKDVQFKQLFLCDIERNSYDKKELLELAETVFQNRVKTTLNNKHTKKIYPNDLCPCGSGKKYKKCHGRR